MIGIPSLWSSIECRVSNYLPDGESMLSGRTWLWSFPHYLSTSGLLSEAIDVFECTLDDDTDRPCPLTGYSHSDLNNPLR